MSEITVRGYINKPARKESAKGGFQTFTLSEKQKNRGDAPPTRNFFDCVDFRAEAEEYADGMFATIKGYLSFEDYVVKTGEKAGEKRTAKRISVQSVEISDKFPQGSPSPDGPGADPFDLGTK